MLSFFINIEFLSFIGIQILLIYFRSLSMEEEVAGFLLVFAVVTIRFFDIVITFKLLTLLNFFKQEVFEWISSVILLISHSMRPSFTTYTYHCIQFHTSIFWQVDVESIFVHIRLELIVDSFLRIFLN